METPFSLLVVALSLHIMTAGSEEAASEIEAPKPGEGQNGTASAIEEAPEPEEGQDGAASAIEEAPEPEEEQDKASSATEEAPEPEEGQDGASSATEEAPEPEEGQDGASSATEEAPEPEEGQDGAASATEEAPEPEEEQDGAASATEAPEPGEGQGKAATRIEEATPRPDGAASPAAEEGISSPEETVESKMYPNCDLVAESDVGFSRNKRGLLTIRFSWARKRENYEQFGSPILRFLVRHGPMNEMDKVAERTDLVATFENPEDDEFTLTGVIPNERYGIQICAETATYPFRTDSWLHGWTGSMDLVNFWGSGFVGDEEDDDESLATEEESAVPLSDELIQNNISFTPT